MQQTFYAKLLLCTTALFFAPSTAEVDFAAAPVDPLDDKAAKAALENGDYELGETIVLGVFLPINERRCYLGDDLIIGGTNSNAGDLSIFKGPNDKTTKLTPAPFPTVEAWLNESVSENVFGEVKHKGEIGTIWQGPLSDVGYVLTDTGWEPIDPDAPRAAEAAEDHLDRLSSINAALTQDLSDEVAAHTESVTALRALKIERDDLLAKVTALEEQRVLNAETIADLKSQVSASLKNTSFDEVDNSGGTDAKPDAVSAEGPPKAKPSSKSEKTTTAPKAKASTT